MKKPISFIVLLICTHNVLANTAQFGNGKYSREICTSEEHLLTCNSAVMGYAWGVSTLAKEKGIMLEYCERFGGGDQFAKFISAKKERDEMPFEELMWQFMFKC